LHVNYANFFDILQFGKRDLP